MANFDEPESKRNLSDQEGQEPGGRVPATARRIRANPAFLAVSVLAVILLIVGGARLWQGRHRSGGSGLTSDTASVLFLTWGADGRRHLAVTSPDEASAETLTDPELDVHGFALSPDFSQIAFVGESPEATSVWVLALSDRGATRLFTCSPGVCGGLAWAPDGLRLLVEFRKAQDVGSLGPSRLWSIDAVTHDAVPMFADGNAAMMAAGFSSDGRWLSYHLPEEGVVRFLDLQSGEAVVTRSATNQPVAWHPSDAVALITALQPQGEQFAENLLRVDLMEGTVNNLSSARYVVDAGPSWSPDGVRIAFSRRFGQAPMGKQLVVMRADGSDAQQLTEDAGVNHGPPRWSPDATQLVFQRFELAGAVDPAIWIIDIATREQRVLAPVGAEPTWLP